VCEGDQPLNSQLRIVQEKVETLEAAGLLRREFSFITGNYRILVISWIIMELAMEMPRPNFQYYVRDALGGAAMALDLIDLRNFLAMAARVGGACGGVKYRIFFWKSIPQNLYA